MASYYSAEEMEKLFEAAQGHKLELIIQLAAFYGLRRAEVMGLRWEAIDFEAKTLTILGFPSVLDQLYFHFYLFL